MAHQVSVRGRFKAGSRVRLRQVLAGARRPGGAAVTASGTVTNGLAEFTGLADPVKVYFVSGHDPQGRRLDVRVVGHAAGGGSPIVRQAKTTPVPTRTAAATDALLA